MVAVLICSIYQTFFVAIRLFQEGEEGSGFGNCTAVQNTVAATVCIGAAALLLAVPRLPLATLIVEYALLIAAAAFSQEDSVLFPTLFATFGAASRLTSRKLSVAIPVVTIACVAATALTASPAEFVSEYVGLDIAVVGASAIGMAARSGRSWRSSQVRADLHARSAVDLLRQRDQAERGSRIAAELHDSVGNKLTSIISLSEGLAEMLCDSELEHAARGINTVARESLEETRKAVRGLSQQAGPHIGALLSTRSPRTPDPSSEPRESGGQTLYEWRQVEEILEQTRRLGFEVRFSERGLRSQNKEHADLCFALTREALTNAVRHGDCPGMTVVTWEHFERATLILVHSAAARENLDRGSVETGHGTGLARLRLRIEARGGEFDYGWSTDVVWSVRAIVSVGSEGRESEVDPSLPKPTYR